LGGTGSGGATGDKYTERIKKIGGGVKRGGEHTGGTKMEGNQLGGL